MWLSLCVYTLLLLCSIVYCLLALIPYLTALLLPPHVRGRVMRFLIYYYGWTLIYVAMAPFVRIRYEDMAPEGSKPGILVFNHRSGSDPFLMAALGHIHTIQIVNGWPMRLPFFGYYARLCEYVEGAALNSEAVYGHLKYLTDHGVWVAAFPEGTRSGSRGMNQFRGGIFRLAMTLKVPVYPCCIAGNEEIPDLKFRFRKRGTVLIRRFPAVQPEELEKYTSAYKLKNEVRDYIRKASEQMDKELDDEKILS